VSVYAWYSRRALVLAPRTRDDVEYASGPSYSGAATNSADPQRVASLLSGRHADRFMRGSSTALGFGECDEPLRLFDGTVAHFRDHGWMVRPLRRHQELHGALSSVETYLQLRLRNNLGISYAAAIA
jgi:hypothetical protein